MNLRYAPEKLDNQEFHRIREWFNTFNAFVQGALAGGGFCVDAADMRDLHRKARRFANKVHGSISKTPKSKHLDDLRWAFDAY